MLNGVGSQNLKRKMFFSQLIVNVLVEGNSLAPLSKFSIWYTAHYLPSGCGNT